MKHLHIILAAAITLTACEKASLFDENTETVISEPYKKFTFTMKGEFANPTFTRGYLAADNTITDLWLFDYMNGECIQTLHQTPSDEAWGEPRINLRYGTHHIYFVASKGDTPTLNEQAHTITWATAKDTFWKDYEVEVVGTSNGNRAVSLERVATKLRVSIDDELPTELATIVLTPALWYYGIDYTTGTPANPRKQQRTISIPLSYIGTAGQLAVSIIGISPVQEWKTDVTINALDVSGNSIGTATITDAPFMRNRATEYSGRLFQPSGTFAIDIDDTWMEPYSSIF